MLTAGTLSTHRGTLSTHRGTPRLRSSPPAVLAFISLLLTVVMRGIAVLRVLPGVVWVLTGYSEYSQGVLGVLTWGLAIAVASVAVAVAVAVGVGFGVACLYACQRKYRVGCWLYRD